MVRMPVAPGHPQAAQDQRQRLDCPCPNRCVLDVANEGDMLFNFSLVMSDEFRLVMGTEFSVGCCK